MDQQVPISSTRPDGQFAADDVICRIDDASALAIIAGAPDPIRHIGFTGILYSGEMDENNQCDLETLADIGFPNHVAKQMDSAFDLSRTGIDASALWERLEKSPPYTFGADLSAEAPDIRSQNEAITLLQMSIRPIPIVPIRVPLVYSSALREQRELLRSLVFWRKRFDIARHNPNLIHAGDDGLLIFTIDSWLVTVNKNPDEAAIDLGSQGSMWLMLGTQRDVHLHGSMLILPPHSGAIVANELAK